MTRSLDEFLGKTVYITYIIEEKEYSLIMNIIDIEDDTILIGNALCGKNRIYINNDCHFLFEYMDRIRLASSKEKKLLQESIEKRKEFIEKWKDSHPNSWNKFWKY